MKTISVDHEGKKLVGVPHIDFKTFAGWRNSGKLVKKGEHSCHQGVSFPKGKDKKTGEEKSFPRRYSLFHISQVA